MSTCRDSFRPNCKTRIEQNRIDKACLTVLCWTYLQDFCCDYCIDFTLSFLLFGMLLLRSVMSCCYVSNNKDDKRLGELPLRRRCLCEQPDRLVVSSASAQYDIYQMVIVTKGFVIRSAASSPSHSASTSSVLATSRGCWSGVKWSPAPSSAHPMDHEASLSKMASTTSTAPSYSYSSTSPRCPAVSGGFC